MYDLECVTLFWDTQIEYLPDIGQAYRPASISMSENLRNELRGTDETLETLDLAFGE